MYKILFIITGSIAATRCKEVFKLLDSNYFQISCVLTEKAKKYLKINEIKKYSGKRIFTDQSEKQNRMLHISLSRENDLIVVCPATANSIAKFANGYADNLASNILLASNKKIVFVPAMNSFMWQNKVNIRNVDKIKSYGHEFIGPEIGKLKCGEFGLGRISETEKIVETLKNNSRIYKLFLNKKCVVTAGPTVEMIDPIRYISNESSGKQGYEIASQLALNGAKVFLISGPTNLDIPSNITLIKIKSAKEMYIAVKKIRKIDIGVFAAAVSDFKNEKISSSKIKKKKKLKLSLINNIDVLKNIGNSVKYRPKILIGFAAETGNIIYAKKKLKDKNCDLIVYNKINKNNQVFGSDYNKISIISKNEIKNYKKMTKVNCAKEIIKYVSNYQLINE